MNTIGDRLKEERLRLGYNQSNFAEVGGVQKNAQIKYESNQRKPDAGYLEQIAKIGCDIQYIITGVRAIQITSLAGFEEVKIEDLESTLELVQVHLGGIVKLMKRIKKKGNDPT